MARLVAFLIAGLTIASAGCTRPVDDGMHTTSPVPTLASMAITGKETTEGFDDGVMPAGWVAHRGNWTLNGTALNGEGDGSGNGLSSLVNHEAGVFANFSLTVDFTMHNGDHPQGAGIVFNFHDEKNYNIVRYSISEQGWHLFTVINGNRNKMDDATLSNTTAPDFGTLVHLRATQNGREVNIFDGETLVIDYTLSGNDSTHGFVGVFARGNTAADFDNFHVAPGSEPAA